MATELHEERTERSRRVVMVRMPAALHAALMTEAAGRRLSMNAVCLEKLGYTIGSLKANHDKLTQLQAAGE